MRRANFGAASRVLSLASVLTLLAVPSGAQIVERSQTWDSLIQSHPCNAGLNGRHTILTDAQSSSSIGGGGGSVRVFVECDGVDTWAIVSIGGGGGVSGLSTADGGTALSDNAIVRGDGTTGVQGSTITVADTTGNLQWEGTTADDFEGNFTFADPTADWTWTWSGSGQVLAPLGSESLPSYSFAGSVDTGFYGTASTIYATVSSTSKLRINANGTSILHGWLYGSGDPNNRLFGFAKWVSASTAGSGAPEAADPVFGMAVYTNEGTTAQNYRTLPSAAAGYQFTFVVQDADGIRVVAAAGDTIRIAGTVSATAGYAQSTTIGSTLTLVAINATEWVAISWLGTWTIDS